ncbi:unnamed protein product [Clonostachys rosea]|uniref:F-box domain-containing protein n=1 Tax=Bionectria ochroleuca TaxID=29856 RepID=A0ABY6UJV6_BIOOC|nr:unnamed protein product [Clonostachys rosea]
MSGTVYLQTIPQEVLAKILEIVHLAEPSKPELLKLRTVSRRFDDQISRLVLLHTDTPSLDIGRRHNWRPGIEWMLTTKARIHNRDTEGPFAFIRDAAHYLVKRNFFPNLTWDDAIVAACRAIVSARDPSWVVHHLVTWEPDKFPPGSDFLLTDYSPSIFIGHPKVNYDLAFGTLQLIITRGCIRAVTRFLHSTGSSNESLQIVHPAFGSVLSVAIAFETNRGTTVPTLLHHGLDPIIQTVAGQKKNALLHACEMNRRMSAFMLLIVPPNVQVNFQDELGHSALGWAARRGWVDTVIALLTRDDINLNVATKWGETPLMAAARKDDVQIAQLILDKTGGKPPMNFSRYSPMWVAFAYGSINVIRLFLDRLGTEFDVNQVMRKGYTPLTLAAATGQTDIARILLAHPNVDIEKPMAKQTLTPLLLACANGHTEMVQMLLERGANVACKSFGRLPFQIAIENGHTDIFELLIDPTINSNFQARAALLWLATEKQRRMGIVKKVLASPEFCRSREDQLGRILVQAVVYGLVELVRELLSHKEIDPNFHRGFPTERTPLMRALYCPAATEIIPLFLVREEVEINKVVEYRTPLALAAEKNASPAIEILLKHPGIDVNFCPEQSKGANKVLRLNRGRNLVPSSKPPFKFCLKDEVIHVEPPLLIAALQGNLDAVRSLCADPRVDLGIKDSFGRTALWWAARNANRRMVILMLRSPRMTKEILNAQDEEAWTALHVAANFGLHRIVEKMLKRPDIDPNMCISDGWTALHLSVINCNMEVTRLLLGHPKIDTSVKLDDVWTPFALHEGCECGLQSLDPERVMENDMGQELSNSEGRAMCGGGNEMMID